MNIESIEPPELARRLHANSSLPLIDVRSPGEFQAAHLLGAHNVPLDQLRVETLESLFPDRGQPIHVVCQSGGRSRKACEWLQAAGVEVVDVQGGTKACIEAGLAFQQGRGSISLERQVRIVAGCLVLLSVFLGMWFPSAGYLLSAIIGGGLIFAGLTDTYGLATILAEMPWNRAPSKSCRR